MTDNCIPVFYTRPVQNNFKTKLEGRPIFEDKEFVKILIPGTTNESPDRPVTSNDIERWPDQYNKFKSKQEQTTEGTPLEVWPMMTQSRVAELKSLNIFSVDQLAELPEGNISKVGPDAHELKKQAKAFLSAAKGSQVEELLKEIEDLKAENEALRQNQKKTPGRKRVNAA